MCVAPNILWNGLEVACHVCWQCRENKINDWVGRGIAETRVSKWARAITLTYGRSRAGDVDHERAAILTYSDVQKWLKLLRRHGFPVRYLVTGEYGSKKDRAHWHVMLWGNGPMPEHELDNGQFEGAYWHHGYSFWTNPTHKAIRYNLKYIQKTPEDNAFQGHFSYSARPGIGALYFQQLAERYVRQGLAPQDRYYSFPEVKKDGGELVQFLMRDRTAELFLEHYCSTWAAVRPGKPLPNSQLVEEFLDPAAWNERKLNEPVEVNPVGGKPTRVLSNDDLKVMDWSWDVRMMDQYQEHENEH